MKKLWKALLPLLLALLLCSGCSPARESAPAVSPPAVSADHVHSWERGRCTECGALCAHQWRGGVCTLCGERCPHAWRSGVCLVCGKVCAHEWEEGVCRVCGFACVHKWKDGVCRSCGLVCAHQWDGGVCRVCGYACPHEHHGAEDLLCPDCGLTAPHSYLNGVCTRCGLRAAYITRLKDVPVQLKDPAGAQGTVECYHYPLEGGEIVPGPHGTALPAERKERDVVVYTPPGYDPEGRYNVVIIAPGAGHNAHTWMERANRLGSTVGRIKGCDLLDRLIENGLIEPSIIVVAEYYLHKEPEVIAVSYGRDLRERVLPFLAAHYATYASFGENGEFIPAPEHFAFVGASYGSMIGWQLLPDSTDLFSYWGLLSGAFKHEEELAERINAGVSAERPVHWLYAGDGRSATGWAPYMRRVEELAENCPALEMDKNVCFLAVESTAHNFSAWDVGLINCLQSFFFSRCDLSE